MTENRKPLLKVQDLSVNYGAIKALRSVSLEVYSGEIVCVIGANGAGKSTLMNGIMGMVTRASGEVLLDDIPLSAKSFQVVAQGVALSPEGRKVFAPLTVHENLMMGAFPRPPLSPVEGTPGTVRRHPIGGRAADARHRPGPYGSPSGAPP